MIADETDAVNKLSFMQPSSVKCKWTVVKLNVQCLVRLDESNENFKSVNIKPSAYFHCDLYRDIWSFMMCICQEHLFKQISNYSKEKFCQIVIHFCEKVRWWLKTVLNI